MSNILTSNALIKSIKRRAFLPESQNTFSPEDFLEMATEEINIGLMEKIIDVRGDYLVYYIDVPLQTGVYSYPIPSRAHGNKLRDVAIVDSNKQTVFELSQIELDEISDYSDSFSYAYNNFSVFYLENDSVVFPKQAPTATGNYVRMHFYMRPNSLVAETRAGTINSVTESTEVDNITPRSGAISNISVANPTVITSNNHNLSNGDKVSITGSNSTPSIDGIHTISVIDNNTFSINVNVTVLGSIGSWTKIVDVYVLNFSKIPEHFVTSFKYDIVQAESPNKIQTYDLVSNVINGTVHTISFPKSQFSSYKPLNGDYVTKATETIVPNMPLELHPIIAQRVAVACLEAMGDEQNKQSAERKLKSMEDAAMSIISNRVEGAPKKIKQRFGTIRDSLIKKIYRRW